MAEMIPVFFRRFHWTRPERFKRFFPITVRGGKPRYLVFGWRGHPIGYYDLQLKAGVTDSRAETDKNCFRETVSFLFQFFGMSRRQWINFMRAHQLPYLDKTGRPFRVRRPAWRFWSHWAGFPYYWGAYPVRLGLEHGTQLLWYHKQGLDYEYDASAFITAGAAFLSTLPELRDPTAPTGTSVPPAP